MLDHLSPQPLYLQVANDLLSSISSRYQPGDKLPSESELVDHYGVSRITIRRSLQCLAERGLVVRRQGKGTFVSTSRIRQDLHQLDGFYASLISKGIEAEARLVRFGFVPASSRLQMLFGAEEVRFLLLQRFYIVDERPLALVYSYFLPAMADVFTEELAARHPTNTLLTQVAGLAVDRVELAIRVQPANREVASFLEVPTSTALLLLDRLTYCKSSDGEALDGPSKYSLFYLRSDRYEFGITVKGAVSLTDGIQTFRGLEDAH